MVRGGRIAEEARVENVLDRTETVAKIWMGLTMGCALCHDHKYDPLSHKEYFQLYDFFNQTSETGKIGGRGKSEPTLNFATKEEIAEYNRKSEKFKQALSYVEKYETENKQQISAYPESLNDFFKQEPKLRHRWDFRKF